MKNKIFILFSCLVLIFSSLTFQPKKANAALTGALTGGAVFSSLINAIGAAAAAGMSAVGLTPDAIEDLKEFADVTWDIYSPAVKEKIENGITVTADGIVIAGNALEEIYQSIGLMSENVADTTIGEGNISIDIVFNTSDYLQAKFSLNNGYITSPGLSIYIFTVNLNENNNYGRIELAGMGGSVKTLSTTYEKALNLKNRIANIDSPFSLSNALNAIDYNHTLYRNGEPVIVNGFDSIYALMIDTINSYRSADGSLSLDFPTRVPYTLEGQLLDYSLENDSLVLEDGTLYEGDIDWKLDLDRKNDLIFPPLDFVLDGSPVYNLNDRWYFPDGTIVPSNRIPGISVLNPELVIENGRVKAKTKDEILVDVITGEITYPPEKPEPKPDRPPKKKPSNAQLPFYSLLALIDLLRAMIMYLARLVVYLVTIPFIPAIPFGNDVFNWFRDMTWLGINVYEVVSTIAMFVLSISVYKLVRRVF